MTVFGYTLAILGIIFGGCLSAWAILMGFQSLFPRRSDFAQQSLVEHPWKCTLSGLFLWSTFGTVGLFLIGLPNPLAKLIGTIWISAIAALTTVGVSGLVQFVGGRLKEKDSNMSEYGSESRGALIIVTSGLLPFVGWFAVVPLILCIGLGAGVKAAFRKRERNVSATQNLEFGA